MAKWFGPIQNPCGCCFEEPPPPPPPPCSCGVTTCLEDGELNYSSFKFEVEFDDGYSWFTQFKDYACFLTCKNVYQVWEYEQDILGFSAFNGTYEAAYYIYDDYTEAWIEGDPIAYPCGVWYFPTITADITVNTVYRRYAEPASVYEVYNESGCPAQLFTYSQVFRVNLETRSGFMWVESVTGATPVAPFLGAAGGSCETEVEGFRAESTSFECGGIPSNLRVVGISPCRPLTHFSQWNAGGAGLEFFTSDIFFRPVGIQFQDADVFLLEPRRYTGHTWQIYPYGSPGIPVFSTRCQLYSEEHELNIRANSNPWPLVPATTGLACNPFFFGQGNQFIPGPNPRSLWYYENTAFRQYFRCIINAP
jgi:hypothetical protein